MKRLNVVYALLYNKENNHVLMVYNKDANYWSLPGGAVEENETLEQAIIREAHEETGLLIKICNIASINERISENGHTIFFTFNAEIIGGEISIQRPSEISEIKWMDIITAEKLMPYHKEGVKKLLINSASYYFQEN